MSGPRENTAHGAPEKPGGPESYFDLLTATRMLPLVGRVVKDVLQHNHEVNRLQPELESLHRSRRTLTWPQRCRLYQVRDELAESERNLQEVFAELEVLGLALIDTDEGQIGFPTIVNNRPAYFSWIPGDDVLRFWHFADEVARRPIPPAWLRETEGVRSSKR
jgi:hypothetical protein